MGSQILEGGFITAPHPLQKEKKKFLGIRRLPSVLPCPTRLRFHTLVTSLGIVRGAPSSSRGGKAELCLCNDRLVIHSSSSSRAGEPWLRCLSPLSRGGRWQGWEEGRLKGISDLIITASPHPADPAASISLSALPLAGSASPCHFPSATPPPSIFHPIPVFWASVCISVARFDAASVE